MSTQPGVFVSRGYPTPHLYRQRGLNTFAVEWTGDNLHPDITDFIVLRLKDQAARRQVEFFVTQDDTLIVYFTSPRRITCVNKGEFLVDQGDFGPWGWVICEAERFWHLYEEQDG